MGPIKGSFEPGTVTPEPHSQAQELANLGLACSPRCDTELHRSALTHQLTGAIQ